MATDFLCERRLEVLNKQLNDRVRDTAFVLVHALEKYKTYFPDFTDHTVLHSMQVIDFCNRLIGEENIDRLNEDELYILLMGAYLHDSGMGVSDEDYKALYDTVVSEDFAKTHPGVTTRETIREFHQSFSAGFIRKYADLFEIPTPEHTEAIAILSKGHRRSDLFDEKAFPSRMVLANGNTVCIPYLAALIRLADELDIAADRNLGVEITDADTVFKRMHAAIETMHMLPDCFIFDVRTEDDELFRGITEEMEKLEQTLLLCGRIVETRTPFHIRQNRVIVRRIREKESELI